MPLEQDLRFAFAAIAAGVLLIAAVFMIPARGGEADAEYWFSLYSADRGSPPSEMRFKLKFGPAPLSICYALGAIGIEGLNAQNPEKDFMGRCDPEGRAGNELFTMREIADRALALLPKEPRP